MVLEGEEMMVPSRMNFRCAPAICVCFVTFLLLHVGMGQVEAHGRFVSATVHAKSLEHNRLGDSADRDVEIYLPPAYDSDPNRSFPVLYHFHGFSTHSVLKDWVSVFQQAMDDFVAKNPPWHLDRGNGTE